MTGGVLAACLLGSAAAGGASAHELPDGQVERAVQVVVFPERIEVEYRFGMSAETMRQVLRIWQVTPAEGLPELEQQLLDVAAPRVRAAMLVELEGQRLEARDVQPELIYLHHQQFACRLTYAWQRTSSDDLRLTVSDRNFPDWPGHFQVALKGRSGVQTASSVAPILVRAPRLAAPESVPGRPLGPTLEARLLGERPLPDERPADERPADERPADERPADERPAEPAPVREAPPESARNMPLRLWLAIGVALAAITAPWLLLHGRRREYVTTEHTERTEALPR